jgi:hypothetical protein
VRGPAAAGPRIGTSKGKKKNSGRGSVATAWVCDGSDRTGRRSTNKSGVERGLERAGPLGEQRGFGGLSRTRTTVTGGEQPERILTGENKIIGQDIAETLCNKKQQSAAGMKKRKKALFFN